MPKIVDHDQRRREFVDALWKVVNTDGASVVSIRTVAAAAGVPKSNIMYYFPTRGHLLAAAVEQVTGGAESSAAKLIGARITLDSAVALVMEIIPTTPKRRRQAEVWRLLNAEESGDPELSRLLDRFNERVRSGLRTFLERLRDDGLIDPDRDLDIETERLHAVIDGLSIRTMANPRRLPPRRIEEIVRSHLRDIAPS